MILYSDLMIMRTKWKMVSKKHKNFCFGCSLVNEASCIETLGHAWWCPYFHLAMDNRCACLTTDCHLCIFLLKVMREEWEKYLLSKVELQGLQTRKKNKAKEPKGFGILNGEVPSTSGQNTEATSISKLEHDALMAAASRISLAKKDTVAGDDSQPRIEGRGQTKGRGRRRNIKITGKAQVSGHEVNNHNSEEARNDKSEVFDSENESRRKGTDTEASDGFNENKDKGVSVDKGVLRKHCEETDALLFSNAKQLPSVHFYALESENSNILDVLKPSIVIVYHPDMTFVREIEIYKAENPSKDVKVYFLFYEDSTEVQKFEASIRRENGAFETLIRQKSLMMIPVDQVCSSVPHFCYRVSKCRYFFIGAFFSYLISINWTWTCY